MHNTLESHAEGLKKRLAESEKARERAELAWKEVEVARSAAVAARDKAIAERDEALVSANSLKSAHAEELERLKEDRELIVRSAQEDAVREFKSSERFMSDLRLLLSPSLILGFSRAIDFVSSMLNDEQREGVHDHDDYHPFASELVNRMAKGFLDGRNLEEVQAEFIAWAEEKMDDASAQESSAQDAITEPEPAEEPLPITGIPPLMPEQAEEGVAEPGAEVEAEVDAGETSDVMIDID